MTGFPNHVRQLILQRADWRCEVDADCGTGDLHVHHRRPKQQGGSRRPDTNVASNGLLCCLMHHNQIHAYPTQAYENGWLVRSQQSPLATPVLYRGRQVLLDDDGFTYPIPTRKEA